MLELPSIKFTLFIELIMFSPLLIIGKHTMLTLVEHHIVAYFHMLWRLGFHLKFDFENAKILYLLHGVLVTFLGIIILLH